ncbi:hypothetical protein B0T18DRAFT_457997 [Schizothecium vesticola]|uniref:HNH nuclease domain-containing protein n=1 Tax=Schizothecium vesticola TaxID=314040 RepID=A0AA40F6D3_9PEZI|nr:hypothetical protein B0T18DRAFT_457997 [Schizothecium vesticola]
MDASKDHSPEHSPTSRAVRPPQTLASTRAKYDKTRQVSLDLQKMFETLSRDAEPVRDPDEDLDEPDAALGLKLASLGVKLASVKKEQFRLEREIVFFERDAKIIPPKEATKRLREASRRYISAGEELWRHQQKKARLEDPGVVPLIDLRSGSATACLMALYRKSNGLQKTSKRPSSFRADAITYYAGSKTSSSSSTDSSNKSAGVWCHVTGLWWAPAGVKAAHIVPYFLDNKEIGEILFGSRAPSLRRAGNSLLLSTKIKGWFDTYKLLIVPVDAREDPIKRWRVDVISSSIKNSPVHDGPLNPSLLGGDLDGYELKFRNDKRPVSRFMYFHFVVSLIRIKDVKQRGWEEVWARYYEQPPFPTPTTYLRKSMLVALATHYGKTDMPVVKSWIAGHGLDTPLKLTNEEATEAARRVHSAVEEAIFRAERNLSDKNNNDEEDEDEDEEDSGEKGEEGDEDEDGEGYEEGDEGGGRGGWS